jgi:hypothetical protein
MFITNAGVYYHNLFFRIKMLLLVLTGINILVYEFTAARTVRSWDKGSAPLAGKTVAAVSLVLWITIIFVGRWIGFTTSQTDVTIDPNINFDELFTPPAGDGGAPQ